MQESAAEANASATDEEVVSAVERNIILWLTNVSHGVNHFQNQMMVVLYPVIMPEMGFGYAGLGVLLAVQSMLGGATQGFYGFATPFLPRTWLLGIGNLVLGFGTLATGFVNSFGGIIGTRGVASIGASIDPSNAPASAASGAAAYVPVAGSTISPTSLFNRPFTPACSKPLAGNGVFSATSRVTGAVTR